MKRTYNVHIDNGLFVASYYAEKSIYDLTVEDLLNLVEPLAEKIASLVHEKGEQRSLAFNTHINSAYTRDVPTIDERIGIIRDQFNKLLLNIGNERTCCMCGERRVNTKIKVGREYMGGIVSQTFFNSANNLKTVDICPLCAFLGLISYLNVKKIGIPTLYISDSDDFMSDITNEMQDNIRNSIFLNLKENDRSKQMIEVACRKLDIYQYDATYITQVSFINGRDVKVKEDFLTIEQLIFLKRLNDYNLINEFLKLNLYYPFVNKYSMINNCVIHNKMKLKSSIQLFLEVEGFELKEDQKQIIEHIANILYHNVGLETIVKDFKNIKSGREFIQYIIEQSKETPLYRDIEELEKIQRSWITYKDYIQAKMILLNHQNHNGGDSHE